MSFIHDNFLLHSDTAVRLFHDHAASQPILDYHCHLSPADVAVNRRFNNLYEIWLEGDHYKWRAMRANGVAETYCTGTADPYDKFLAWASTVPQCLRNPLYHWTHLELARYFGIHELLDTSTAARIWALANEQLQGDALTARGILERFRVRRERMRRVMVVAGVVLFATNAFAQEGGMGRGGGPAGPAPTCPASGYGAQAYYAMFGQNGGDGTVQPGDVERCRLDAREQAGERVDVYRN